MLAGERSDQTAQPDRVRALDEDRVAVLHAEVRQGGLRLGRGPAMSEGNGFAKRGGASSIQTYVRDPSMVRYYKRLLDLEPLYAVLEKSL